MSLRLGSTPSSFKRVLAGLLTCGLLIGATPAVTDAAAKPPTKPTAKPTDAFGGDGRKN